MCNNCPTKMVKKGVFSKEEQKCNCNCAPSNIIKKTENDIDGSHEALICLECKHRITI